MYETDVPISEATEERKPPTIADIVRQKTDGGAMIIDFFTDVMTGRIEGAELCHRIDAAKQLVKYGHKGAAEFLEKNRGIPCGHSIGARKDSNEPCTDEDAGEENTPVDVTMNAPAYLTREFLTVLSGIDESLMRQLIRAQTADGATIIDFLDDVMNGRETTFRTHHRLAAARELITHILRDEGLPTPSPSTGEGWGEGERGGDGSSNPALSAAERTESVRPELVEGQCSAETPGPANTEPTPSVVPAQAETQRGGAGSANPANTEHTTVVPAQAGTQRGGAGGPLDSSPSPSTGEGWGEGEGVGAGSANPANTEPTTSVVPAKAEPAPCSIRGTHPRSPSQLETRNQQLATLPRRRPDPSTTGRSPP